MENMDRKFLEFFLRQNRIDIPTMHQILKKAKKENISAGKILLQNCLIDAEEYKKTKKILEKQSDIALDETKTGFGLEKVKNFGKYKVLREIGRGGIGLVYEVQHPNFAQSLALKVLLRGKSATKVENRRFLRECEILKSISHPNIIKFYDAGQQDNYLYMVMEYIEGNSFEEIMEVAPRRTSLKILQKVAEGLAYLHKRDIIHRDIKPSNILITSEEIPKISDFGISKKLGLETITITGIAMGTPHYMSPWQVLGQKNLDASADIYSLGVILYKLLAGKYPICGTNLIEHYHLVVENKITPPGRLSNNIDKNLNAITMKALDKNKSCGYHSAGQLAKDLGNYLAGKKNILSKHKKQMRFSKKHFYAYLLFSL